MIKLFSVLLGLVVFILNYQTATARTFQSGENFPSHSNVETIKIKKSKALQIIVDEAVKKTLEDFKTKDLKPEEVAVTLIDLNDPKDLRMAEYRGEQRIYPASVVKMFYLAAFYRQLEDGKIKLTPELERGLKNMIVDSGNESTGYILDVLTQTTSGPEMSEKEFKEWAFKRNAVNRFFKSLGYKNISINQKTHCEDAWGREQQFRGYGNKNRNMLTTNATARLMAEIALGKFINPERSQQMMNLMKRDWEKPVKDPFYIEFTSHALKPGTKLWSKEGFTSKTRHDVTYIETPGGLKLVLAIFTENHSKEQEILPGIARGILKGLGEMKR